MARSSRAVHTHTALAHCVLGSVTLERPRQSWEGISMQGEDFQGFAAKIAAELGIEWDAEPNDSNPLRRAALMHPDGLRIDVKLIGEGTRVCLSAHYPDTETAISNRERAQATVAVSRGARAVARRLNGVAFMPVYVQALERVMAYNDRQARIEAERIRIRETLARYIPEELRGNGGAGTRPEIKTRQEYGRKASGEGREFTQKILTDVAFRGLSEQEAKMIMQAYASVKGHIPEVAGTGDAS